MNNIRVIYKTINNKLFLSVLNVQMHTYMCIIDEIINNKWFLSLSLVKINNNFLNWKATFVTDVWPWMTLCASWHAHGNEDVETIRRAESRRGQRYIFHVPPRNYGGNGTDRFLVLCPIYVAFLPQALPDVLLLFTWSRRGCLASPPFSS